MSNVIYINIIKVHHGCRYFFFFFCDIVSMPWLGGHQMDSVWDDLLSSCLTEVEATAPTASPWEGIRALSYLCLLSSLFSPGSPTAFTIAYGEGQCWLTTERVYPPVCSCPMAQRWVILFPLRGFQYSLRCFQESAAASHWLLVIDCFMSSTKDTRANMQKCRHVDTRTVHHKHRH